MKYDGIGFNCKKVEAFLKEDDFVLYCERYPHYYQGDPNRELKLRRVYQICQLLKDCSTG